MNNQCFICNKKLGANIFIGFDKHFCSNICRKKIYYINNSLDPSFKNPSCWVRSNEDIIPFLEKIKKRNLSVSNNLNQLDISKSTNTNFDISNDSNLNQNKKSNMSSNTPKLKENNIKKIRESCNILLFNNITKKEYNSACNIIHYFSINKILSSLYIL